MKALKKLTMLVLAIGMTASFAACDMLNGLLGKDNSESAGNSETSQTSEVESNTGEAFTEEEFNTALQWLYSQTNLAVVVTDGQQTQGGYPVVMSGKYSYADGKFYSEMTWTDDGFSESLYTYVGEVDGEYYQWISDNKTFWDYDEMDAGETTATYVKELLDEIFVWCNFDYDQFNEKTGMMEFTGLNSPTVGVKIEDGKIVEFRFEEVDGDWYLATVSYGNATVGQLPELD